MKRTLLALLTILLVAVGTVACGPESGEVDNDDNQSTNNDTTNNDTTNNDTTNNDTTNNDTTNNDTTNNDTTADGDAQAMAENFGLFIDTMIVATEFECECTTDDPAEEQLCLDEGVSADDRDDTVSCMAEVIEDHHTAPPQAAVEVFDCMGDVMKDTMDCFDAVYEDFDDVCSMEGAAAFEVCADMMEPGMDACEAAMEENDPDGAAEEWFDGIDPYMDDANCFAAFDG